MQIISRHTSGLHKKLYQEIVDLCSAAYNEDFRRILDHETGPGVHLMGFVESRLVSHVMYIERRLFTSNRTLKAGYIEAVATLPSEQGKGYASRLLTEIPGHLDAFDLAVLSPSDESFYSRLGWEAWKGPLSYIAPDGSEVATPEEGVMIYRLPKTGEIDLTDKLVCEWRAGEVW